MSQFAGLRVHATKLLDASGDAVRLRGTCLGGWMNMENFITGYAANEGAMRASLVRVLGDAGAEHFFDRLASVFFTERDAEFLASLGLNSLRVPVNYRHFEDDDRPMQIKAEGFELLDRVIELCARRGIYTIIDLHALPGSQNYHWHSDNATHQPAFFTHRHFQDRVVHLWEVIADRYRSHPFVAGYNPINEPADATRAAIGPFYERLVTAIRAIDTDHIVFLDGNTYSTEFDVFSEPYENTVYTCHDYAAAGLGAGGPYPGVTKGAYVDADALEAKFLERTAYCRKTQTPIWVGEFGPIYTGDPARDEQRYQLLSDQLEIFRRYDAGFASWMYKDIGRQGLVHITRDSPYAKRFDAFVAKKNRLGADFWGSSGTEVPEITGPLQDFIAAEFPDFDPYPWGRSEWVQTLLQNIMFAEPLVQQYAELFRGLNDEALDELADSFAFENCVVREPLAQRLAAA